MYTCTSYNFCKAIEVSSHNSSTHTSPIIRSDPNANSKIGFGSSGGGPGRVPCNGGRLSSLLGSGCRRPRRGEARPRHGRHHRLPLVTGRDFARPLHRRLANGAHQAAGIHKPWRPARASPSTHQCRIRGARRDHYLPRGLLRRIYIERSRAGFPTPRFHHHPRPHHPCRDIVVSAHPLAFRPCLLLFHVPLYASILTYSYWLPQPPPCSAALCHPQHGRI